MTVLDILRDDLDLLGISTEDLERCKSFYRVSLMSDDLSDEERSIISQKIRLIMDILKDRG